GHHARGWRHDRRTGGCRHINPIVGLAGLAVKNPLAPIHPADASRGWPDKLLKKIQALDIPRPGLAGQGTFLTDTLQLLRRRSHMFLLHPFNALDAIVPFTEADLLGAHLARRRFHPQGVGEFAITPDTEYEVSVWGDPQWRLIEPHPAAGHHLPANQRALGQLARELDLGQHRGGPQ